MKILADTDNYMSHSTKGCHLGPQHLMRCIRPQNVLTKLKVIHSSVIVNMIYEKYNLKE